MPVEAGSKHALRSGESVSLLAEGIPHVDFAWRPGFGGDCFTLRADRLRSSTLIDVAFETFRFALYRGLLIDN